MPVWDMADFLRAPRLPGRLGLGTGLAHLTFQRFPRAWQIRVIASNAVARYLWEKAIEDFTGTVPDAIRVNVEGASRYIFRLESTAGLNGGPDTFIPSRG
jgi:predicted acetyltransferase